MGITITGNCPFCGSHIYDAEPHAACLRDRFAMAALTGMLADSNVTADPDVVAEWAYRYADAMMTAHRPSPEVTK